MRGNKRFVDGLVVGLATSVKRWVVRSTPKGRERWARFLGRLLWSLSKRRRAVATGNVRMAFPSLTASEQEAVAKRSAMHFGHSTVDFMCAEEWTKESLADELVIEGLEHLERAHAGGKGVILITGHLGHWERLSAWMSLNGYDMTVVVRDANQAGVNQMVNDMRRFSGTKVVSRGDAARPILESLRANGVVGIIPDQNTDEAFIPFFGHPAGTVLGPGVMAERTGAAVLPGACFQLEESRYMLKFYPLLVAVEAEGSKRGEAMMREVNEWLEGAIQEHPEQYLWMHDRWRAARQAGLVP